MVTLISVQFTQSLDPSRPNHLWANRRLRCHTTQQTGIRGAFNISNATTIASDCAQAPCVQSQCERPTADSDAQVLCVVSRTGDIRRSTETGTTATQRS